MEMLSSPSFFQSHFPEATTCKLLCFVFWVFFTLIFNSILEHCILKWGFPGGSVIKNLYANVRDGGSIPGSGSSPGEGNGTPLQYSCLENPMDRGTWWAAVHGVAQSQTRLRAQHSSEQKQVYQD